MAGESGEAVSLAEAQKRDDWNLWKKTVEKEMNSMQKNQTWTLAKLPANRTSRYGFVYCETYSPVPKLDTVRTVLALASRDIMAIHQIDIETALLNGQLEEEIFLVQPE